MIESPTEALNILVAKKRGPVWPLVLVVGMVVASLTWLYYPQPPLYACSNHEVRHGAFNMDDICKLPDCKGWHEIEE